MMTGTVHPRGKGRDDVVDSRKDFPTSAAIVKRFRPVAAGIPGAVAIPEPFFNVPFYPGQHAGFLGSAWDPWRLTCDPGAADFHVPELTLQTDVSPDRLGARRELLGRVSSLTEAQAGAATRQYAGPAAEAFDLLGGGRVREAFDLAREPAARRDRHGRHKLRH